jgi:hypothetical protein
VAVAEEVADEEAAERRPFGGIDRDAKRLAAAEEEAVEAVVLPGNDSGESPLRVKLAAEGADERLDLRAGRGEERDDAAVVSDRRGELLGDVPGVRRTAGADRRLGRRKGIGAEAEVRGERSLARWRGESLAARSCFPYSG